VPDTVRENFFNAESAKKTDRRIIHSSVSSLKKKKRQRSVSEYQRCESSQEDIVIANEEDNDFTSPQVKIQSLSMNGAAKSVYKSVNPILSNFISENKSQLEGVGVYGEFHKTPAKLILENRGTKCECVKQVNKQGGSFYTRAVTPEICGDYCKHLPTDRQREIIQRLLEQEG